MNWLTLCAKLIARSVPGERLEQTMRDLKLRESAKTGKIVSTSRAFDMRLKKEQMTTVVWTTPLGLPIVQPYRKTKRRQIMTSVQSVFISDPNSPQEGACSWFSLASAVAV